MALSPTDPDTRMLPVLKEQLHVDRERVETGAVRVRVVTTERTQALPLQSRHERAEVERRRVERIVDERREPWHDGDTLVVPVYEERVVTQRVLVLVEEVRLSTRRETRHDEQHVALREQHAVVERRDAEGRWRPEEDISRAPDAPAHPLFRRSSE